MAEGLGIDKNTIKRVVKSKWFLPALGVGGVIVVLLVVAARNAPASASGTEDYPGEVYQPEPETPISGSPDLSGLEGMLSDLFGEYAGTTSGQIQQQQQQLTDYITAQTKAQNDYLDSFVRGISDSISQIQPPGYFDPGYFDPGFAGYDNSSIGYDDFGSYDAPEGDVYTESDITTFDPPPVLIPPPGAKIGAIAPTPATGKVTAIARDTAPAPQPIANKPPAGIKPPEQPAPPPKYTPPPAPTKPTINYTPPAAAPPKPVTAQPRPPVKSSPPPTPPKPPQQRGGRTITK